VTRKICMKMQIFLYERGIILTEKQKKWLAWSLAIAWMGVIFLFSAQQAEESARLSGGILKYLLDGISVIIPNAELNQDLFHLLIRKGAHFGIYGILGVLILNAVFITRGKLDIKTFLVAVTLCMAYAITDEVHQMFVPGRAGMIEDVAIDTLGAATGALFWTFLKSSYVAQ